jgi:hypothetical protein
MTGGANSGSSQNQTQTPAWLKGLAAGQQIAQMGQMGQTPQLPQSPMQRRPMGGMPAGFGGGAVPTGSVPGAGGMMPQAPQPIGSTMTGPPQFSPGSGAPLNTGMQGNPMSQLNPQILQLLQRSRGY